MAFSGNGHSPHTSLTTVHGLKLPGLPLHKASPACPWLVSLTCVHTRPPAQEAAGQGLLAASFVLAPFPSILALHRSPGTKREGSAKPDRPPACPAVLHLLLADSAGLQGSQQREEFQGALTSPDGVCDFSVGLTCSVSMHSATQSRDPLGQGSLTFWGVFTNTLTCQVRIELGMQPGGSADSFLIPPCDANLSHGGPGYSKLWPNDQNSRPSESVLHFNKNPQVICIPSHQI